jgi:hypothetical protein
MNWQEIRAHYPQQWLLLEAIKAHTEASKRFLDQLAVVSTFPDSVAAMKSYAQLHREAPERELYVFHTSRKTLEILERQWLGIRGAQSSVNQKRRPSRRRSAFSYLRPSA